MPQAGVQSLVGTVVWKHPYAGRLRNLTPLAEWLNYIGSVASIISFLISIYVLVELRQIRQYFLFRVRIPSLLKTLQLYASGMSRGLNNFEESRQEIETMLARCESTLRSLSPKLSGAEKRAANRLANSIRSCRQSSWWHVKKVFDREQAWSVYIGLQGVIESIKNLAEDAEWRR